jgi:hypothetical protein
MKNLKARYPFFVGSVVIVSTCFMFSFRCGNTGNHPALDDSTTTTKTLALPSEKNKFVTGTGKIYYVSPKGNDTNAGTSWQSPLKTIQVAVQKMSPGDTCYLREGIYRESVFINKNNLTIKNFGKETAVISGLDPVTNWTRYKDNIFKTTFIPEEKDNNLLTPAHLRDKGNYFIQVFADNSLMPQAQHPNQTGSLLNWEDHGGDVKIFLKGQFQFLGNQNKEWEEDYWKGAVFHAIVERKFNAVQGVVGKHRGAVIQCEQYTTGWKKSTPQQLVKNLFTEEDGNISGIGKGFITNHLNALDADGEWFWNKQNNLLYFQPPANTSIAKLNVEAKSRKFAFIISGADQVHLQGLHIHAAGIDIRESNNTIITGCRITYPMPFYIHQDEYNGKTMINITGNGNIVKDSYIAHAWGSGIIIHNGIKNSIENNVIEDVNWMGTYNACIRAGGSETQIRQNTLRNSGRFLIEGLGLKRSHITHNHMYNGMLIGQDGGGFYTYVTDGEQTEIAFNWVHDIIGVPWERSTVTDDHNLSVGIYLDGGCQNYYVHHNVIWNVKYGVMLNANPDKIAKGNRIDYNTIVSKDVAVLSKNMPLVYINNSARYNLGNKKVAALVEKEGNVVDASGDLEKKFPKRDGKVMKKSIQPDSFSPNSSAGAYEKNVSRWKAGADTTRIPIPNF